MKSSSFLSVGVVIPEGAGKWKERRRQETGMRFGESERTFAIMLENSTRRLMGGRGEAGREFRY